MPDFNYNEKIQGNLTTSAKACFDNANSILRDAEILFEKNRYSSSLALAILAQEEFSKSYMLHICSEQNRWDVEIYKALIHHEKKQAVIHVMLKYVDWFNESNAYWIQYNKTALVPAPLRIHPPAADFAQWLTEARQNDIKGRELDKLKQKSLYVSVARNAELLTTPDSSINDAQAQLIKARSIESTLKTLIARK